MKDDDAPPNPEKIYNIVYCSRATGLMPDSELDDILKTSQANNQRVGITGLLVFGGGMFLQSLEGPRAAVETLMRQIYCDPRHDAVVQLQSLDDLDDRLYPGWSMHAVQPGDIREILADSLERCSGNVRQMQAIKLLIELLDSEALAPLRATH